MKHGFVHFAEMRGIRSCLAFPSSAMALAQTGSYIVRTGPQNWHSSTNNISCRLQPDKLSNVLGLSSRGEPRRGKTGALSHSSSRFPMKIDIPAKG